MRPFILAVAALSMLLLGGCAALDYSTYSNPYYVGVDPDNGDVIFNGTDTRQLRGRGESYRYADRQHRFSDHIDGRDFWREHGTGHYGGGQNNGGSIAGEHNNGGTGTRGRGTGSGRNNSGSSSGNNARASINSGGARGASSSSNGGGGSSEHSSSSSSGGSSKSSDSDDHKK